MHGVGSTCTDGKGGCGASLLDDEPRTAGQDVDHLVTCGDDRIPVGRSIQSHLTSAKAQVRLHGRDGTRGGIAGWYYVHRVILYFTRAIVSTCTTVRERAHVHPHALGTGAYSGRHADRSGFRPEARGLEHQFTRTERTVVVPVDPGVPTIPQKEWTIGVHCDAIGGTRLHRG